MGLRANCRRHRERDQKRCVLHHDRPIRSLAAACRLLAPTGSVVSAPGTWRCDGHHADITQGHALAPPYARRHVLPVLIGGDLMSDASSGYDRQTSWRNDGGFRASPFDPEMQPDLFRGVLTRRFIAFLIDLVVLSIPIMLGVIFIALFGLLTLGFGWMLFWLVSPLSAIWAILYYGLSLGGL